MRLLYDGKDIPDDGVIPLGVIIDERKRVELECVNDTKWKMDKIRITTNFPEGSLNMGYPNSISAGQRATFAFEILTKPLWADEVESLALEVYYEFVKETVI